MWPVAGSREMEAAVTGVEAGAGPVTMNVAGVTVLGSIRKPEGTAKVALMAAAGHTPVAFAAGFVDSTVTFPAAAGAAAVKVQT
jgi:hypothetical protein